MAGHRLRLYYVHFAGVTIYADHLLKSVGRRVASG
jgi:hypothetical protein